MGVGNLCSHPAQNPALPTMGDDGADGMAHKHTANSGENVVDLPINFYQMGIID